LRKDVQHSFSILNEQYWTVQYLRVSEVTVRPWINNGKIWVIVSERDGRSALEETGAQKTRGQKN